MSLAPANSRGFFLKARFAVNGIQCAARSFGTATAGRAGLLSSIGCLFRFGRGGSARHGISFAVRRKPATRGSMHAQSGSFGDLRPANAVMAGLDSAIHLS